MTCGELRDRVRFFEPTALTDSLRGQSVTYEQDVATVWAQWRGLTSREILVAQAMDVQPQYRVTIRFRRDLTTKHRAVRLPNGPTCQIIGITDSAGTQEWLELDLVEVL